MNPDDVDGLFSCANKRLPASPKWLPHNSRDGEMKARLAIEVEGISGRAEIELTVKTSDPNYVVMVVLVPVCVSRLCMGLIAGHRNKITGETITEPHFHRWEANRHLTARTRETLPYAEIVPPEIKSRDEAFAWFLEQVGIESPSWLPVIWPGQGELF